MKKLLTSVDIAWSVLLPLIACFYLVSNDSQFSGYIIAVGWLMFLFHGKSIELTLKTQLSIWPVLWSLANTAVLLTCLYFEVIELEGFLIIELVSETTSYLLAMFIFVVTNQKINGQSFWKTLGPGIAVMNIIFIFIIAYPFLAEWLIFIDSKANNAIYWIVAISTLSITVIKKMSVLREVVVKVNRKETPSTDQDIENPSPGKTLELAPAVYLVFIIFWFVSLIIVRNL